MDKLKPMIYFQTKSDFLDNFLLSGSLCLGQWKLFDQFSEALSLEQHT